MQTARCWGGLKLGVGVFECESIHAKIGIHTELKNALKNSPFFALLCVFYSKKQREFRLSLVTSGFDYEANKVTFSSPKRQSFILGHDKTATAQKALSNLIATAQNAKTTANSTAAAAANLQKPNLILADLEKAFSQEPVAKEFYQNITACFLEFLQSAKLPENVSENDKRSFLLRLFCRLLFCKFLEKKGLVSSEIFNTKLSQNYYFDILQTLFFATLNTEPSLREKNHLYSLLSPQTKELFSAVPYLNGGLFSPQENDFFKPQEPHAYFRELDLPNSVFDKLFEVLSRYNFTLDEQSSFDTEVALDPELLGTVFESLLSELFTDNNGKDLALSLRKSTGSYYTPREIVSYMVKESLILYLKFHAQDEEELRKLIFDEETAPFDKAKQQSLLNALKKLKILDPACGSGAFPMGILHEILHLQEKCGDTRSAYERKLEILQECIYGVDIQPMATEIARLRCFLSLIIDQDSNNIQPLPNLEFKFITANSLVNLPVTNSLHYAGYEDDIAKLSKLRSEYFGSHEKAKLQHDYTELRRHIVREDLSIGMSESFENPLLAYDPFDSQSVAGFFDSEYMFGVKSFDIVIGNPPYGAKISAEDKKYFKENYKYANQGSLDTYKIFIEKGFNLLKKEGNLNYIVPLSAISNKSNIALHKMLLENCEFIRVSSYSHRPAKVFTNAELDVSIFNFIKTNTKCKQLFTTKLNRRNSIQSIGSVLNNLCFINSIDFVQPEAFCKIGLPIEKSIMQKLYSQKQTLKDLMGGKQKLYYRTTGGRYYKIYTTYSTKSNTENSFNVINSKLVAALMSSTLFWWFRNAYAEYRGHHIYQFERFPIPNFSKEIINKLEKLGKEYETDIEKNHDYSNGVKTYKIRKSKHIIDKIDRLICPLYGLTEEEMEFIIGYELEFRV